LLRFGKV